MAYTFEAPAETKYQLFLDNTEQEKTSDASVSSASEFETKMDVNVNPLIFLRSRTAQLGITHFSLSELALAVTRDDKLEVTCTSDTESLTPNRIYNEVTVEALNKIPLVIQLENVTAAKPNLLISYLNDKLSNVNIFLLYRYSLICFDTQIWNGNAFKTLSAETDLKLDAQELSLLQRYCDIVLFSRHAFHELLLTFLGMEDVEGKELPEISFSNPKPVLTKKLEEKILAGSKLLLSLQGRAELTAEEGHDYPSFIFSKFYDFDFAKNVLTKPSQRSVSAIETVQKNYLAYLKILEIKPDKALTEADKTLLRQMLDDNLTLVSITLKMSQILSLEMAKLQPTFSRELFQNAIITLAHNPYNSTVFFHLSNDVFLPERDKTTINVTCSKNVAYSLGCDPSQSSLYFGPLTSRGSAEDDAPKSNTERRVVVSGPCLGGSLRAHPRIIRLASNLLAHSEIRDNWLGYHSEYHDFHVIHSQTVDPATLDCKFIAKPDDNKVYHRLLRSSNILQQIKFIVVDENCKKIFFPKKTICRIGLCLTPFKAEDTY